MLVIVPAFNEAASLPRVLEELRVAAPECDVCVVDDGSTDATHRVAASHGVTVLRCAVNLGIGGAVQAGYLWAYDRGYDVAVQLDGDGQHDPTFIRDAIASILEGDADVVVGSRFLHREGFRSTAIRRWGIRYLCWFLWARCGAKVTDPTSGFRAAGRRAIELFVAHYPSDYPEPEAIALAARKRLRIAEVPVVMRERAHGRSSITALRTIYYLVKVSLGIVLLPRAPEPARGDAEPSP